MSRYRIAVALTSLIFTLGATPCQIPHGLYSPRAIRRAKVLLQLQLLELREQGLERARAAVLRKITIDQLLDPHPALGRTVQGALPSNLKQRQAFGTTKCL